MSFYLYSITEASAARGNDWPEGIADSHVAAIEVGSLALLVSEIERLPAPVQRGDLQQHNAVNCALLETGVCVPLRYGTMAPSRDACGAFIADQADRWNAAVERLRGRVELSLKILMPVSDARGVDGSEDQAAGPGAMYLRRRRLKLLQEQAVDERRDALEREVRAALSAWTEEIVVMQRSRLLGVAALVAREHFGEAERHLGTILAHTQGRWTLGGPWPPYSFVDGIPDDVSGAARLANQSFDITVATGPQP